MQIGLLNNYLEQQSLESNPVKDQTANSKTGIAEPIGGDIHHNQHKMMDGGIADYQPSQRTVLLTAVAEDFDVTNLALNRVDDLQHKLQEFDLLTPITQNAMQMLHRLRGEHSDINLTTDKADLPTAHINAVNVLKYKQQQMQQQGADLYQRRQITELVRLFSNLESAHMALNNPVTNVTDKSRISA